MSYTTIRKGFIRASIILFQISFSLFYLSEILDKFQCGVPKGTDCIMIIAALKKPPLEARRVAQLRRDGGDLVRAVVDGLAAQPRAVCPRLKCGYYMSLFPAKVILEQDFLKSTAPKSLSSLQVEAARL